MLQLKQIVRSSERIVHGSLPFSNNKNSAGVECFAKSVGPPLQTFIFARDNSCDIHVQYAQQTFAALVQLRQDFPTLNLHDRVLVIVPDVQFLQPFEERFQELLSLDPRTDNLSTVRAVDASAAYSPHTVKAEPQTQNLVVDCVDAVDGLERLFVFVVALDSQIDQASVIDGALAECARVRSMVYRAMTRAMMMEAVINEAIRGGFLEFLHHVKTCAADDDFDAAKERSRLNRNAVSELTQKVLAEFSVPTPPAAAPHTSQAASPAVVAVHGAENRIEEHKELAAQNIWDVSQLQSSTTSHRPKFMPFHQTAAEVAMPLSPLTAGDRVGPFDRMRHSSSEFADEYLTSTPNWKNSNATLDSASGTTLPNPDSNTAAATLPSQEFGGSSGNASMKKSVTFDEATQLGSPAAVLALLKKAKNRKVSAHAWPLLCS